MDFVDLSVLEVTTRVSGRSGRRRYRARPPLKLLGILPRVGECLILDPWILASMRDKRRQLRQVAGVKIFLTLPPLAETVLLYT